MMTSKWERFLKMFLMFNLKMRQNLHMNFWSLCQMTGENCLPGKWNDKFKIICFEITYIYFALLNGYIKLLTFQQVSGFVLIQLLSSFILSKITMKLSYVCLLNLCFHLSEINFFLISFNSVEFPDNLTLDSPFHKLTLSFFHTKNRLPVHLELLPRVYPLAN